MMKIEELKINWMIWIFKLHQYASDLLKINLFIHLSLEK